MLALRLRTVETVPTSMFAEQTFQDTEGVISRNASHFKTKKAPRGIGEISDAFLDEKIIWKYPRNLSKSIVFFGKICYNWINPKNVDDTYRRAALWQERNNRPCSGRKS